MSNPTVLRLIHDPRAIEPPLAPGGCLEGLERLKEFPLSLRFIREVHDRLMRGVRGGSSNPGEFRHLQNWIGAPGSRIANAKYVPPPVPEMLKALDAFEKFLHAPSHLPALIRFALHLTISSLGRWMRRHGTATHCVGCMRNRSYPFRTSMNSTSFAAKFTACLKRPKHR